MRVESIEPLGKRRRRVCLEDGTCLALYGGEIRRYHIEEGEDCPEEMLSALVEEVLCKRARERVLYLLKGSDKTEAQVRRKLKEGYYPESAIDQAVDFAKRYGYVDDERYVRRYLESGQSRKSKRQLSCELLQRGIDQGLLKEILEEQPVDEEAGILAYFQKKRIDPEGLDRKELLRHKQALVRKGYSYDMVNHVLNGGGWED